MGDQGTSLTTGSRGARGKKRPQMNQQQQQRRSAREQRLEDRVTRKAERGKNAPKATAQFERMKRQDQRRAARSMPPAGPSSPAAPTSPASPTNPAGSTTGPPSGQPAAAPDLASQLQPYTAPMPPLIKAYMDKLSGGQVNAPSFADQFGAYKDIANREAQRQTAAIGESMGASGSRYSSALLGQEGKVREDTTQNLALAASDYQSNLEKQQFDEISAAGGLAYGANEAGMNRFWQDFLRQTSPPPFVGGATDVSGGYGLPATVFGM